MPHAGAFLGLYESIGCDEIVFEELYPARASRDWEAQSEKASDTGHVLCFWNSVEASGKNLGTLGDRYLQVFADTLNP